MLVFKLIDQKLKLIDMLSLENSISTLFHEDETTAISGCNNDVFFSCKGKDYFGLAELVDDFKLTLSEFAIEANGAFVSLVKQYLFVCAKKLHLSDIHAFNKSIDNELSFYLESFDVINTRLGITEALEASAFVDLRDFQSSLFEKMYNLGTL